MNQLSAASPHAIIMIGLPGAGKSAFASKFADTFQAPIVNQTQLARTYNLTAAQATSLRDTILNEYLKTRRTVLIDGGVNKKSARDALTRKLIKAGYQPLVVWVQTDAAEALRRATKPYPAGSGLTADAFNKSAALFNVPSHLEQAMVISGKHTYASQLKIVLRQLAAPDAAPSRLSSARTPATRTNATRSQRNRLVS